MASLAENHIPHPLRSGRDDERKARANAKDAKETQRTQKLSGRSWVLGLLSVWPCIIGGMTQLDVLYRYGVPPTEAAALAVARVREVYGVRQLAFDEAAKTVRVEYDATRLNEPMIHQLLRRAGLDILERVTLAAPPEPAPAAAAAS